MERYFNPIEYYFSRNSFKMHRLPFSLIQSISNFTYIIRYMLCFNQEVRIIPPTSQLRLGRPIIKTATHHAVAKLWFSIYNTTHPMYTHKIAQIQTDTTRQRTPELLTLSGQHSVLNDREETTTHIRAERSGVQHINSNGLTTDGLSSTDGPETARCGEFTKVDLDEECQ